MRQRNLQLDDYGISCWRYKQLYAMCRQYPEKRKILSSCRELDAMVNDGLPHGNSKADPTARKADIALQLQHDIALIEDTARAVDRVNWLPLLQNVTEGVPFEHLQVYCGRRQFYEMRRKFFLLLDNREKG